MHLTRDEILARRSVMRMTAATRIGWDYGDQWIGGKRLNMEGSIKYLSSLGIPDPCIPNPESEIEDYVAEEITELYKLVEHGYAPTSDGFFFLAEGKDEVRSHKTLCAFLAHAFIRRGRSVAWVTHSEIVDLERQAMLDGRTEEDLDLRFQANTELFDLRAVYELLVVTDVRALGVTGFEERAITRVLGDRAARELPTLVVVSPVDSFELDITETPVGRSLDKHLSPVGGK